MHGKVWTRFGLGVGGESTVGDWGWGGEAGGGGGGSRGVCVCGEGGCI